MTKEDDLSPKERKEVNKEIDRAFHQRILSGASSLRKEFRKQVSTAIITAFGLVIALVWKDVVTALIPSISAPGLMARYPFLAQIYAAIIVTLLAVLGILIFSNWAKKSENK